MMHDETYPRSSIDMAYIDYAPEYGSTIGQKLGHSTVDWDSEPRGCSHRRSRSRRHATCSSRTNRFERYLKRRWCQKYVRGFR